MRKICLLTTLLIAGLLLSGCLENEDECLGGDSPCSREYILKNFDEYSLSYGEERLALVTEMCEEMGGEVIFNESAYRICYFPNNTRCYLDTLVDGTCSNLRISDLEEDDGSFDISPASNVFYGEEGTLDIDSKDAIYKNTEFGISFSLSDNFYGGFIDQDNIIGFDQITFYIENSGIDSEDRFASAFSIFVIPFDKFDAFKELPLYNKKNLLGKNNKYYFYDYRNSKNEGKNCYTNLDIFDVE